MSGGKDAFDTVSSCQRVTVTELCARFELNMLLQADTLRSPDGKAQPGAEQSHDRPTRWGEDEGQETEQQGVDLALEGGGAGGPQAGKLTATGVQELRSFFEVYSKRHVEKQCACYVLMYGVRLGSMSSASVLITPLFPSYPLQTAVIISSGNTTPSLSRGASGSDLGTLHAMSASQAKLSLLLPFSHDGAPARHHGLPVSPTFRRPTSRVDLSGKEEDEEDEAQQGGGSDRHATLGAFQQQQPAGASADGGEGGSETGAAAEEQQPPPPSHALSPATVEIFTHDEIVCLRLIFALFDDNGDDFVDQGELLRYAEETGAVARGLPCICGRLIWSTLPTWS